MTSTSARARGSSRSPRSMSPERRPRSPIKVTSASELASVSSDGSRSSTRWQELSQSPVARKLHILPSSSGSHTIPIPFQIMLPPKLSSPSPQLSPQQSPEMGGSDSSMVSMTSTGSGPGRLVYNGSSYERVDDDVIDLDGDPFSLPPSLTKTNRKPNDQLSIIEEHSESSSRASSVRRRLESVRDPLPEMPSQIIEDDEDGDDSVIINRNKTLPEIPATQTVKPNTPVHDIRAGTSFGTSPHRQAKPDKPQSFLASWHKKFAWSQPWDDGTSHQSGSVKSRPKSMAFASNTSDNGDNELSSSATTKRHSMPVASPPTLSTKPQPVRTGIKVMAPSAKKPTKPPVLARTSSSTSHSTVSTPSQAPTTFTMTWGSPTKAPTSPPRPHAPPPPSQAYDAHSQAHAQVQAQVQAQAPPPIMTNQSTDRVSSHHSSTSESSWDSLQRSVDISLANQAKRHSSAEWVTEDDEDNDDYDYNSDKTPVSPLQVRNMSNYGSSPLVQMAPQAFLRSTSHEASRYFEDSVIGAYMDTSMVDRTITDTILDEEDELEKEADEEAEEVNEEADSVQDDSDTTVNDSGNEGMGKRFSFPNNATNITNDTLFKQHPVHHPQRPRGYTTPSGQIEIPDLNHVAASAYSSSAPRSSLVLFDDVCSESSKATTVLEPLGEPTAAAQKVIRDHFEAMHDDDDSNTEISSTKFSMFNRSKLAPPSESSEATTLGSRDSSPTRHQRSRSHHQITLEGLEDIVPPRQATTVHRKSFTMAPTTPEERCRPSSSIVAKAKGKGKSVKILSPPPPSDTSSTSMVSAAPEEMEIVVSPPPAKVEYAVDFVESNATDEPPKHVYTANTQSQAKHSIYARRYPRQHTPSVISERFDDKLPETPPDQVVPAPLSASSISTSSYRQSGSESAHTGSTAPSEVLVDLTEPGYDVTTYKQKSPAPGTEEVSHLISVHEDIGGHEVEVVLVADDDDDDDELLSIYSKYRRNYLFRHSSTTSKTSSVATSTAKSAEVVSANLAVSSSAFVDGLKVVSGQPMETIAEKVNKRVTPPRGRVPVGVDGSPSLVGAATMDDGFDVANGHRVCRVEPRDNGRQPPRQGRNADHKHKQRSMTCDGHQQTLMVGDNCDSKSVNAKCDLGTTITPNQGHTTRHKSPETVVTPPRSSHPSQTRLSPQSRSSRVTQPSPSRIPKSPRMANIRSIADPSTHQRPITPPTPKFRHSWTPNSAKKQLIIPPTAGAKQPIKTVESMTPSPTKSAYDTYDVSPTPKPISGDVTRKKTVSSRDALRDIRSSSPVSSSSAMSRKQARKSMYDMGRSYEPDDDTDEASARGHARGKSLGSQYYDYTNDRYDFNSFMQSRTTPAF